MLVWHLAPRGTISQDSPKQHHHRNRDRAVVLTVSRCVDSAQMRPFHATESVCLGTMTSRRDDRCQIPATEDPAGGKTYDMAATDRDWIGSALRTVRETFETLFDTRTVRLLLLGGLAFVTAFVTSSRQLFAHAQVAGVTINTIVAVTFSVIGALLILLTIASGLLSFRKPLLGVLIQGLQPGAAVLGGQLILGIDVARECISYGALSLTAMDNRVDDVLAKVRMEELVATRTMSLPHPNARAEVYRELTLVVLDLLATLEQKVERQVTVAGIAITTPSWIDMRTKTLASPIGPFPVAEPLADGLAARLWLDHRPRVQQFFATPESQILGPQDLAEKIFLDVDSRSVVRYDLHQRLRGSGAWRNYACVLMVEGVGAGLVLNGEIYYGSHGSEGEIGHTTVHLDVNFRVSADIEVYAETGTCACQLPGLHWEQLSSTVGLLRLAQSFDKSCFDLLSNAYGRSLTSRDLIEIAGVSRGIQPVVSLPRQVVRVVTTESVYREYLEKVFREYARIVTLGVANLVNVLDLEHVVIGGPIMAALDRLDFRNEIRKCWGSYVLRGQNVGYSFESFEERWQGAALLFWDPAYRRNFE